MQTLTLELNMHRLNGLSQRRLFLLQSDPVTMPELMQGSQHLLPWHNVTCLNLACVGSQEFELNGRASQHSETAVCPADVVLNGHSVVSGNGLPWHTDMNRDGALVTHCMFH